MSRRWVLRLVVVVLLGGSAAVLLWRVGVLPHDPALAGVTATLLLSAAVATWWSATDLPRPAEAASWYAAHRQEATPPMSMDYRLVRLRRDLRETVQHPERPDAVHPLLRSLAAHRLRERHGVDLDTDPDAAERYLTPLLRDYLARPLAAHQRHRTDRIARALAEIEQL